MVDYRLMPFTRKYMESLIDLTNLAASGRRHQLQADRSFMEERLLDHPGFDPNGLLLTIDGEDQVIGAIHAVVPPVQIPHYQRLAGRGFIIGPFVKVGERGRGIGTALFHAAEEILKPHCDHIRVHGLRTPFYHVQEGPRQPLFGSTEIMGLTHNDLNFLDFLQWQGYELHEEPEVSMLGLSKAFEQPDQNNVKRAGLEVRLITAEDTWQGKVSWREETERGYGFDQFNIHTPYRAIALIDDDTLVGHCMWYPMSIGQRAALADLRLDPAYHGYGLGKYLTVAALADMKAAGMREVELHTSPSRNSVAYSLYSKLGFVDVVNWLVFEKRL